MIGRSLGLVGLAVLALHLGCAPEPRSQACSNDGECRVDSPDGYCLENRCVECVTSASCGDRGQCVAGVCEIRCVDARGCPDEQACVDGMCARD